MKKIIIIVITIIILIALAIGGIYLSTSNKKVVATSNNIKLTESTIINKAGTYTISGTLSNGSLTVNTTGDVTLILDNVDITSNNGPAIYIKKAKNVEIVLKEGSTNKLTDSSKNSEESVIYSVCDLTINGEGSLTVKANKDGISTKDDLVIENGNINIEASDDGIKGRDSVTIKDGEITINSKGDSIKTTNDENTTKGDININGGKININTEKDGIQSIKDILISDGTIEIVSGDDGIRANEVVEVNGGDITLTSTEGLEGTYVKINDGTINIEASDDGVNATNKSSAYTPTIEINGGDLTINMGQGDTDAIDSNGNLYINGGNITITANSPFDYDGEAKYSGGNMVINGTTTTEITNQMLGGGPNGMPNMNGGMAPNGR